MNARTPDISKTPASKDPLDTLLLDCDIRGAIPRCRKSSPFSTSVTTAPHSFAPLNRCRSESTPTARRTRSSEKCGRRSSREAQMWVARRFLFIFYLFFLRRFLSFHPPPVPLSCLSAFFFFFFFSVVSCLSAFSSLRGQNACGLVSYFLLISPNVFCKNTFSSLLWSILRRVNTNTMEGIPSRGHLSRETLSVDLC